MVSIEKSPSPFRRRNRPAGGFGRSARWATIIASAFVCVTLFTRCLAEDAAVTPPLDPRQREILDELASLRPPEIDSAGVWMLAAWDSEPGLEQLFEPPTGPGNAAAHFKRLEELFPSEKEALEKDGSATSGVDELLAAADKAECALTPDFYPVFVTTAARQPDFVILRLYLNALLQRAENLERDGDIAGAECCFRAGVLAGRHLVNDRTSTVVFMTGLVFELRSMQRYVNFLRRVNQQEKMRAAEESLAALTLLLRACYWKANIALSDMGGFACLPAVIRIATEDSEVFWRKEAVVRLAMLRHGAPEADGKRLLRDPAWERLAEETLSLVSMEDPDLSVRKLAAWSALNVRHEDYERLEHFFPGLE